MFVPVPMVTAADISALLLTTEMVPLETLFDSSNGAYVCQLGDIQVVYKPLSFETQLWDFPDDTLGRREVAASQIDQLLGWGLVPPTVWTDEAPFGPGSVQLFIADAEVVDVAVVGEDEIPKNWFPILKGELDSKPVVVIHRDAQELLQAAIFDAVINNADRKGGHILRDGSDRLWLIDHGVVLHHESKLRTVLWGWVGVEIPSEFVEDLVRLQNSIGDVLDPNIFSNLEIEALATRIAGLIHKGLPAPSTAWPAVPWPIF
jgi:uncharacterized repeat protein (TIGR03843 family)